MTDCIIIGAGPSGLSTAIEAGKLGLSVVVLDKGNVVDYLRRFPVNLVWFSTPELLEIGGIPFVISSYRPSREEVVRYYQRVARQFRLDVRPHDAVTGVRREPEGFTVVTQRGREYRGRSVVFATGYFDHPNRLGVPGEDQPNVQHCYDEPFRYFGNDVVVVGGRNSAVEAALELYRNGAQVTLVHRGPALSEGVKYWILPDIENRIKNGQVKALFGSVVEEFRAECAMVRTPEGTKSVPMQFAVVLVGYHPDTELLRACAIDINPETLAPVCNPETFETNVPGIFVAGSVVAGKNTNKVFVENGRLHGAVIAQQIKAR
jgi:thioredoxin reductase (NADPH)